MKKIKENVVLVSSLAVLLGSVVGVSFVTVNASPIEKQSEENQALIEDFGQLKHDMQAK